MGPIEDGQRGGVDAVADQVPRLEKFRRAHPEWRIWKDREADLWRALRLSDGGQDTLVRYELRDVLDELGAP